MGKESEKGCIHTYTQGFRVGSDNKESACMKETWVRSLGQQDPLEKKMAMHSSILAWRIPWTEGPGGLQFIGSQRDGHDRATNKHILKVTRAQF